jgi:multidrug resistance efflux pump
MIESVASLPPKFRADLIVSRQDAGDTINYVVKDPACGRFFRFREIEGFVVQLLDGQTSIEAAQAKVEAKFAATLSLSTLEQFVDKLRRLGLLETEAQFAGPHRTGALRGNAFYLRLKAFDPDRFFHYLVSRTKCFFTPSFIFVSAVFIALAGGITISRWSEIGHDFQRLYSLQSLLLAYATMLVVITLHEFAHGLTCKHYGGSVRELGFMLLYFQPAFYCNVSDAWLFPEKSKRLWVTFAGAYFEIFVWAIATLAWWVTDPFTYVNYLALVVMATSGIKTLFNLNPLIKLDGYYLLSDYLDIPNLRQRAFSHVGDRIRRITGSTVQRIKDATRRERKIYFIYGVLAAAYSFWLFSFIALHFGGFLVKRYQAWGFIIFSILLLGVFQQPLKRLLRGPLELFKVQSGMSKWIKRSLKLAVLGVFVAALFLCHMDLRISGPFIVLPVHNADVRAEVEGIIQEIHADEGDAVHKGDLIASLFDRDSRAELIKLKAEIEEKQARLNLLKAGSRPEEIDLARTLRSKADERLKYARSTLEMDKTLFDERLVSKKEYEQSKELVAVRENELQEAKDRLNVLLAGSRREEIEAIEAEISRLQAQQRYLKEQLQLLKVASPITGVVTTHKLKDKIGQAVKKGDLIAKVHEMETVTVEIAIPEKEIADISVGQRVVLKARAYPHTDFEGKVTSIAPTATKPDDWKTERTVLVTTQLENTSLLLKPEMTGNAKVYCGDRRLLDLVTRRLVRYIRVEFWSWW